MITKNTILCLLVCVFMLSLTYAYAGEVKFTTYYPAPYGEYKELETTGNTYLATGSTADFVGIGTDQPDSKLHVDGGGGGADIRLTSNDPIILIRNVVNPQREWHMRIPNSTKAFTIRDNTAGANRLVIETNGNVGIGPGVAAAAPASALHVDGGGGGADIRLTSNDPIIIIRNQVNPQREWHMRIPNSTKAFTIRDNTEGANRLVIDTDGRTTISDVLRLEPRASAPTDPSAGDIYVNSSDNNIYCYLNSGWRQLNN